MLIFAAEYLQYISKSNCFTTSFTRTFNVNLIYTKHNFYAEIQYFAT